MIRSPTTDDGGTVRSAMSADQQPRRREKTGFTPFRAGNFVYFSGPRDTSCGGMDGFNGIARRTGFKRRRLYDFESRKFTSTLAWPADDRSLKKIAHAFDGSLVGPPWRA